MCSRFLLGLVFISFQLRTASIAYSSCDQKSSSELHTLLSLQGGGASSDAASHTGAWTKSVNLKYSGPVSCVKRAGRQNRQRRRQEKQRADGSACGIVGPDRFSGDKGDLLDYSTEGCVAGAPTPRRGRKKAAALPPPRVGSRKRAFQSEWDDLR